MTTRAAAQSAGKPDANSAVWGRSRAAGKDPDVEKLVGLAYMVADGNRYVRSTIKDALHGMGIRAIVEMDSAEEALGYVEKHAIDAILVGYEMAGMSGAEFAWRLRRNGDARLQQTPVIMISEHADESHVRKAINAGVNEFLPRPFSRTDLFARIRRSVLSPKPFIVSANYIGPDRRLKDSGPRDGIDRRGLVPDVLLDCTGAEPKRVELRENKEPAARLPADTPPEPRPGVAPRFSASSESAPRASGTRLA